MEATRALEEMPSFTATAGMDRCPNCGATLASDQRYCIACGERRLGGGLRETLPRAEAPAVPSPNATGRVNSLPSTASFIAGIATLLIAMGVGVLIGRTGDTTSALPAAPVKVVTVGGAAGTTAVSSDDAGSANSRSAKTASKRKPKTTKASAAEGGSAGGLDPRGTAQKHGVKLPPPVVKVGSKCEEGAKGCAGGKFTGNFFGG